MISKTLLLLLGVLSPMVVSFNLTECDQYPGVLPALIRSGGCDQDFCRWSENVFNFWIDVYTNSATASLGTQINLFDFGVENPVTTSVTIPEMKSGCNGLIEGSCPLAASTRFVWGILLNWTGYVNAGDRKVLQVIVKDDSDTALTCFNLPVIVL